MSTFNSTTAGNLFKTTGGLCQTVGQVNDFIRQHAQLGIDSFDLEIMTNKLDKIVTSLENRGFVIGGCFDGEVEGSLQCISYL